MIQLLDIKRSDLVPPATVVCWTSIVTFPNTATWSLVSHCTFSHYHLLHSFTKTKYSFTYTISIILAMLRMYSYRYTSNIVVSKLCEEAEEKGKRAPSVSTRPISRDEARLLQTPARSSVSSSPISPVSSFHPAEQNEIANASVPDGSRGSGFRGGGADPPPYMPDLEAGRMEGHASESNETRLSGYVKNQDFPGVN